MGWLGWHAGMHPWMLGWHAGMGCRDGIGRKMCCRARTWVPHVCVALGSIRRTALALLGLALALRAACLALRRPAIATGRTCHNTIPCSCSHWFQTGFLGVTLFLKGGREGRVTTAGAATSSKQSNTGKKGAFLHMLPAFICKMWVI
jgi:hypothetical protein